MRNNSFYTVINVDDDILKVSDNLRRLGANAYVMDNKISVFCPDVNSTKVNKVKAICCRYKTAQPA